MWARMIGVLCLALAIPAVALAARAAEKNPVLDLSGLIRPGEWTSTTLIRVNGKPQPPEEDTFCIAPAELRDFLNRSDAAAASDIEKYTLDGGHLHFKGAWTISGKKAGTIEYDRFFDNRVANHGSMKVVVGRTGMTTTMEISAYRIGVCPAAKPSPAGDSRPHPSPLPEIKRDAFFGTLHPLPNCPGNSPPSKRLKIESDGFPCFPSARRKIGRFEPAAYRLRRLGPPPVAACKAVAAPALLVV